jgi:hypothetical protein
MLRLSQICIGPDMRERRKFLLGVLNLFVFGTFFCLRDIWTLLAVSITSAAYLFVMFRPADE